VLKVPLASSGLREKDIKALNDVLRSGDYTMGQVVKTFEQEMSKYLGVEYFVMVNSGSSANLAIIEACLRPAQGDGLLKVGDEVLVPAIAWPTTIWPLIQLGLKPIFVDVDKSTVGIDLDQAKNLIENSQHNIKAIFPIHPLGLALDGKEIKDLCDEFGLVEIHDTCESLGAFRDGNHAGIQGLASSYSFYFSHHLTTMEGGGVATNNLEFADNLKSIRSHGWSRDRSDASNWSYGNSDTDKKFTFVSTGFNIRPMEIQAAIGLSQLSDLDSFLHRRREIAQKVKEVISGSHLEMIEGDATNTREDEHHSRMLIALLDLKGNASKERTRRFLENYGIETRPPLTGNFLAQPAAKNVIDQRFNPNSFPNAQFLTDNSFLIGCHHDYSDEQIEHLLKALTEVVNLN
jgi:CDP-6-deoxy-D-xylo-4-hexulose-3-dehydrase